MLIVFIKAYSKEPSGKERSEKKRGYTTENEPESGPEAHVGCRVNERESSRDNNSRRKIREEGEGGEVLDRASHLAGNNRRGGSRGHDKTHQNTLCEDDIAREMQKQRV